MLAENSNYCLINETEYSEQDPEDLAETQTGLKHHPACVWDVRAVNSHGQFFGELKPKEIFPKNNLW